MKNAVIAVAGNPNSGKTTLLNSLTGSRHYVGNWPGVTVEKIEGEYSWNGSTVRVVDLPGIYSLSAFSEDERIARDYILGGEADLIVNIVDAANLERNLFLTSQLIELKKPLLFVLTMMDLAKDKGLEIDLEHLRTHLGCPVVAVNATEAKAAESVKKAVAQALGDPKTCPVTVSYPNEIEDILAGWAESLRLPAEESRATERWMALKLLEGDPLIESRVVSGGGLRKEDIAAAQERIKRILHQTADEAIADATYGFIYGVTKDVVRKKAARRSITEDIDRVVMHRFWSIPIFFSAMYFVFWVTINIGGAFIDFFDILFGAVFVDGFGSLLTALGSPPWLKILLADGVGAGIQTVSTFVPIIFTMFFALSILEDSGYMARAAFIMDRFMRLIGLPGKSFVPMLVGFGCTVPAILGTRTLDNKRDRYMTIFMTPFMSCGARLPVYAFFAAVFFGSAGGAMVFSLYLVGILLAVGTGFLLKRSLFRGETSHFIMELPPYHAPRIKHILIHTWSRLKFFIIRAGKVITLSVVILGFLNSLGTDGSFGNENSEKSVLSGIGKAVTPVFTPLGVEKDNWPATVAIFSGVFAKEAVIGTLTSLYSQNVGDRVEETPGFGSRIVAALVSIPQGLAEVVSSLLEPIGLGFSRGGAAAGTFSPEDQELFSLVREHFPRGRNQAYSYLLFILIYVPCVAAMGAAIKEMGTLLGVFMAFYTTLMAWIVATLYYQFTVGGEILWIAVALGLLALLILGLRAAGPAAQSRGAKKPGPG